MRQKAIYNGKILFLSTALVLVPCQVPPTVLSTAYIQQGFPTLVYPPSCKSLKKKKVRPNKPTTLALSEARVNNVFGECHPVECAVQSLYNEDAEHESQLEELQQNEQYGVAYCAILCRALMFPPGDEFSFTPDKQFQRLKHAQELYSFLKSQMLMPQLLKKSRRRLKPHDVTAEMFKAEIEKLINKVFGMEPSEYIKNNERLCELWEEASKELKNIDPAWYKKVDKISLPTKKASELGDPPLMKIGVTSGTKKDYLTVAFADYIFEERNMNFQWFNRIVARLLFDLLYIRHIRDCEPVDCDITTLMLRSLIPLLNRIIFLVEEYMHKAPEL